MGTAVAPVKLKFKREVEQEITWRLACNRSLIEFAKTMPIPGVPQSDNWDEVQILGDIYANSGDKDIKDALKWDDGRFDNTDHIPKITTELGKHHILILQTCQDTIEGKLIAPDGSICRRTMIFAPPGSAKSTYVSVVTPSWCMGKYPGNPIILTAYADMLAKKQGKRARQLCSSPEYNAVFEATLDPHTKAADQWALTNGSEYLACGLQSGLTGNRAFGAIWDDPVKGRRAAESRAEQVATMDSYKDDFRTRKTPLAWEIGIMTRWHQKDLAGNLLPEGWNGESGFFKGQDGYWWNVVCIQAICESETDPLGRAIGEPLWPEWFATEGDAMAYWKPMMLDSRAWGSLFQQTPTPPEGDMFKQEWVNYYPALPQHLNKYMSADYAVTRSEDADDPDMTVIAIWGMDSIGRLYWVDGWHGKADSAAWTDLALDFQEVHGCQAHVAGGGPIRRGTEPWMRRRMAERKVFIRLEWLPETFGKDENLRSFQAMMSNGMVYWPSGNEEAEWLIRHLVGYGTLRYDDGPDACAMIGRYVHKLWETREPKVAPEKPVFSAGQIHIKDLMPKRFTNDERW